MAHRKDLVHILKGLVAGEIDLSDSNEALNPIVGLMSDLRSDLTDSLTVTEDNDPRAVVGTDKVGFCEVG